MREMAQKGEYMPSKQKSLTQNSCDANNNNKNGKPTKNLHNSLDQLIEEF
jgi:hypothetical protein